MCRILVIGGGPAGLRAAEVASESGVEVVLCDQKRSVGRKFLVAGKSGLNVTHGEERERFLKKYSGPADFWALALERFDNQLVREWAAELGVETFEAGSGRVYPVSLKGAPLLRRWIERLRGRGVDFRMNHRLVELARGKSIFENGEKIQADAIILALGGGSWPQTGADGRWMGMLGKAGVSLSPLEPANCGWEVDWSEALLEVIDGQPLKNVVVRANGEEAKGELMVTRYGLEGGPIYKLGRVLREMENSVITLDFKPTFTVEELVGKMPKARKNVLRESKYRWKLGEAARELLKHRVGRFESAVQLAEMTKNFPLELRGPRPLAEAISSAGGVRWESLEDLMLKDLPGVFVAGEMMDWEAPTGGYLLQGCFATGTLAAEAALRFCVADS